MDQKDKDKLQKILNDLDSDPDVIQTKRAKIKSEIDKIEQQRK